MVKKRISPVTLLLGLTLVAGATQAVTRVTPPPVPEGDQQLACDLLPGTCSAQNRNVRLTFRFLVESSLRPPNDPLEWVDGSPDDVLCFEGIVQHPSLVHLILGEATGCMRIVAEHPLKDVEDAILALKVRHIIQLIGGDIVDDDFAIVAPLLGAPTRTYTHGLTATTDSNNIRPELSTGFFRGKEGIVGVNGNMNLSQFPDSILFNALFTIDFTK